MTGPLVYNYDYDYDYQQYVDPLAKIIMSTFVVLFQTWPAIGYSYPVYHYIFSNLSYSILCACNCEFASTAPFIFHPVGPKKKL